LHANHNRQRPRRVATRRDEHTTTHAPARRVTSSQPTTDDGKERENDSRRKECPGGARPAAAGKKSTPKKAGRHPSCHSGRQRARPPRRPTPPLPACSVRLALPSSVNHSDDTRTCATRERSRHRLRRASAPRRPETRRQWVRTSAGVRTPPCTLFTEPRRRRRRGVCPETAPHPPQYPPPPLLPTPFPKTAPSTTRVEPTHWQVWGLSGSAKKKIDAKRPQELTCNEGRQVCAARIRHDAHSGRGPRRLWPPWRSPPRPAKKGRCPVPCVSRWTHHSLGAASR